MYSWVMRVVGLKNIVIGVGVAAAIAVVISLQVRLSEAEEAQKYAEDNVVLVTTEFDRLQAGHERLTKELEEQEWYYEDTVDTLIEAHQEEIKRVTKVTIMIERIRNATPKEDGNISSVLGNTLDSLRMYH